MQIIRYPKADTWRELLKRPLQSMAEIEKKVKPVLKAVRKGGDEAIRTFTWDFDGVD